VELGEEVTDEAVVAAVAWLTDLMAEVGTTVSG